MLKNSAQFGTEQLAQIYPLLVRFTDWWFNYRNPDGDGLPQYHHGNDSGWDNATVFDPGFPVKGADLAAFLVIQMDVLAEVAGRLGKTDERANWQQRSNTLLEKLLSRLWRGDHFVSPRWDGQVADKAESLFNCLPVVLGMRLPADVRQNLVKNIRRLMTPYGLATEHPDSLLYEADGYWRGPIWAPSTLLIVDGLRACGEVDMAADIARRFCNMARNNGFAENYDALTGQPLRDKAYTWTASSFLVLAHEYI
jgi:glycogen debranching enzyme